ncbi:phenylacetate--CoA ligase family protein [Nocardia sp. BMG111209]|uniref:phenylacetate--CoA ligase family protein n=1 Tax=Nocardia sp. BMG111209 TaxID=1160137 RepID=UPI00037D07E6|nr:phenylacetate--CoA ligase family protein [Nocardia sp. BMG111209]
MTEHLPVAAGDPPGTGHALATFRRAARDVPAYQEFLAENGIDAQSITTAEHFARIPAVTKTNYLRRYPRAALLWGGDPVAAGTWSASSGSSGTPTYWPREHLSLEDSADCYDRIFRQNFGSHLRETLLVVGFAMGNWIGGTYTLQAVPELRRRGHKLSVVTPGIDLEAFLTSISDLGPDYEQVVLAGYPPFIKDALDRADHRVLKLDLAILLAGERITEEWRDHILDRIGKTEEPHRICLIYGTADAGVMGHETPATIAIRRLAHRDPAFAAALFGSDPLLPTFVEYDPQRRYTEVDADGRFLFTVDSAMPLIRYRISDEGAILTPGRVADIAHRCGHRLPIRTSTRNAAFLALRGRSDVAASYYAVKIYPDSIVTAMQDPGVLTTVTGKFALATRTDGNFAQTLDLQVELCENVEATVTFSDLLRERVVAELDRTNSEYRRLHAELGSAAEPIVTLVPFGGKRFRYHTKFKYVGGDA